MKKFHFWIRRNYGGPIELISIMASDSWEASNNLPRCVYWDITEGEEV